MKKIWLLGFLASMACENIDNFYPKTREELLRPKTWVVKDVVMGAPGSAATTSVFNTFPACERDNTFRFRSENRLYISEETLKCDPDDPQEYQGSWSLKNDVLLEMISPYDTLALTVEELTDVNMRAYIDETVGTTTNRYTFIFAGN